MQGPGGMLVTAGILQQSQGVSADWDLHLELDLGLDMDMDMGLDLGWRRGQGPGAREHAVHGWHHPMEGGWIWIRPLDLDRAFNLVGRMSHTPTWMSIDLSPAYLSWPCLTLFHTNRDLPLPCK